MVCVRETLTTAESDPKDAPDHPVRLRVAGHFAGEPSLGNRIRYIVFDGFSCGKQDLEEKTVPAFLNVFFSGAKVIPFLSRDPS
jgi:hypothetical protein